MRQETFIKALLSLPDSHVNVRAWLYLVARNIYFNEWKKQSRQFTQDDISIQNIMDKKVSVDEDRILENLLRKEEQRLIYQALCKISQKKKEVLELQYFGGFTLKETAAILQISQENARVLSYRGKAELKKCLKEVGIDDIP